VDDDDVNGADDDGECDDDDNNNFGVDPTLQGQLLGGVLDGSTAVHLLLTNKSGLKSVPTGVKENVYFILDHSRNFEDRAKRKASDFGDDCGVWNSASGSSPKFHYILNIDGTLSIVFLPQNQYCDINMYLWTSSLTTPRLL